MTSGSLHAAAMGITITAQLLDQRVEPDNDGWSVQLDITLDPGEELLQAATEVHQLLSGE
ncbi:hypothetical protein GCM10028820_33730 [Tessaracoccus terricola]